MWLLWMHAALQTRQAVPETMLLLARDFAVGLSLAMTDLAQR